MYTYGTTRPYVCVRDPHFRTRTAFYKDWPRGVPLESCGCGLNAAGIFVHKMVNVMKV